MLINIVNISAIKYFRQVYLFSFKKKYIFCNSFRVLLHIITHICFMLPINRSNFNIRLFTHTHYVHISRDCESAEVHGNSQQ